MYLAMKSGAVIASGTLNKDPETKTFDSGKSKASFGFKADSKKNSSGRFEPKWANCAAWSDSNAYKDAIALHEGMTVIVTGRLNTREYNNKTYEEITVDAIAVCGVPTRSVDDLKQNFPQAVKEWQGVFADVDDDDEASLPF